MYRLTAPVKKYAWGSTKLLADLTGQQPTETPQAEMWFGTHPTTPTTIEDGTPLAELIDLPYLVKLLAADQPLSIQAHPNVAQARAGYAAENATGLPPHDPKRVYRDANHKPELLVSLTDFTAMAGFRDPVESAETFANLARLVSNPQLASTLEAMAHQLAHGELKEVFAQLIEPSGAFWKPQGWTKAIFTSLEHNQPADPHLRNALAAAKFHPDDPGALVTLLMHLIDLSPGDAIFIPSGTIHAYVSGLGLEIMATSDNVIRGGLTIKHIAIEELNSVVDYRPSPPPRLTPSVDYKHNAVVTQFQAPVKDFQLARYDLTADACVSLPRQTNQIAVCTSGYGSLISGEECLEISAGTGIYLPPSQQPVKIAANANAVTVFIAGQPA